MAGASLDPLVATLLGAALAGVFAQAAWHKGHDLQGAAQVVADYRITPVSWAHFHATAGLAAEACIAAGLLAAAAAAPTSTSPPGFVATLARIAPIGALVLLVAYSFAIGVNLARGRRDIDCGCSGPVGTSPRIGPWLLVRNAVLALAVLALLALPVSPRTLHWVDAVSLVGGVAVLALVWTAVHGLAAASAFTRRARAARGRAA